MDGVKTKLDTIREQIETGLLFGACAALMLLNILGWIATWITNEPEPFIYALFVSPFVSLAIACVAEVIRPKH